MSSLKRASSSRVGPNAACAALRIAASIVSIRTFSSMPFSCGDLIDDRAETRRHSQSCAAITHLFRCERAGAEPAARLAGRPASLPAARSPAAPLEHESRRVDSIE